MLKETCSCFRREGDRMLAKCYLCGKETDEFTIYELDPEIAVCFDCEEKIKILNEVRKELKKESNRPKFITKAIQDEEQYWLRQILKGGETYGNKR